tara:strand:+ start:133 stop:477 length:345 start_codon:yes stop_codon:yes gene_type:complete
MDKLKDILSEVVNTYQIQASMMSKREINITKILDQVRGVDKVTIVNNITPEEYPQKDDIEFTRVQIKFVTRNNPKDDLKPMRDAMLYSDVENGIFKIEGLMNLRWKEETLNRVD